MKVKAKREIFARVKVSRRTMTRGYGPAGCTPGNKAAVHAATSAAIKSVGYTLLPGHSGEPENGIMGRDLPSLLSPGLQRALSGSHIGITANPVVIGPFFNRRETRRLAQYLFPGHG